MVLIAATAATTATHTATATWHSRNMTVVVMMVSEPYDVHIPLQVILAGRISSLFLYLNKMVGLKLGFDLDHIF